MATKQIQIDIDELSYPDEYAEFIMDNGDASERPIHNGDSLTVAMEDGYMWAEFLESKGLTEEA